MRTEVFYSSSEDHPGYGADADDTERIESNNSSQIQKSLVASVLSQGDKKKSLVKLWKRWLLE